MIALTIAAIVCIMFLVIIFALSAQNDKLYAENQRLRNEVYALNATLSKRPSPVIYLRNARRMSANARRN